MIQHQRVPLPADGSRVHQLVVALTTGDDQRQRTPVAIHRGMDLGGQPAAGATKVKSSGVVYG